MIEKTIVSGFHEGNISNSPLRSRPDAVTLKLVYLFQGVDVGSSRSLFIVSPTHHGSSNIVTTCSWEISTTKGYILQLTIENMTISSCNASCCAYRYIQARDGIELSDPLLGTYCDGSHPGLVSTKGNQMFIKYYGRNSRDAFQATVHSKKGI